MAAGGELASGGELVTQPDTRPAKNEYFCTVQYIGELGWGFGGLGKWGWEGVGLGRIWVID